MKARPFVLAAALLAGACVAPVGPVEVTRFHDAAALPRLGQGTIAVLPAPGFTDADSLELASYRAAVGRELQKLGYREAPPGTSQQVAEVRVDRYIVRPDQRGPVSVGGGASVGSYGSGVGLGIGIDLSGGPKEQVTTRLAVSIRDAATHATLWEGRANFTVSAKSPLADTQLGAAKVAEALFKGFPGTNGETIEVE